MSKILIHCPSCSSAIRVPEEAAGREGRCPQCRAKIQVPSNDKAIVVGSEDEHPPSHDGDNPRESSQTPPLSGNISPQRISRLPLYISCAAFVVAITSFGWTSFYKPLGSGISSYDFSTPSDALKSQVEIKINRDIRAALDIEYMNSQNHLKEKFDTLKIHKDVSYQGKKILFISYKKDDILQYDIACFEKNADTGLWFPSFVSTYAMSDAALENSIEEWKEKIDDKIE